MSSRHGIEICTNIFILKKKKTLIVRYLRLLVIKSVDSPLDYLDFKTTERFTKEIPYNYFNFNKYTTTLIDYANRLHTF